MLLYDPPDSCNIQQIEFNKNNITMNTNDNAIMVANDNIVRENNFYFLIVLSFWNQRQK